MLAPRVVVDGGCTRRRCGGKGEKASGAEVGGGKVQQGEGTANGEGARAWSPVQRAVVQCASFRTRQTGCRGLLQLPLSKGSSSATPRPPGTPLPAANPPATHPSPTFLYSSCSPRRGLPAETQSMQIGPFLNCLSPRECRPNFIFMGRGPHAPDLEGRFKVHGRTTPQGPAIGLRQPWPQRARTRSIFLVGYPAPSSGYMTWPLRCLYDGFLRC
jgi:hypothetical protein